MKLKINNNLSKPIQNKILEEKYKIPRSIILYLKESYDKDSSLEILKWFCLYLKEDKKINLLNWYLKDINELKLSLNNISNKKFEYNEEYENLILKEFTDVLQKHVDTFLIINEYKNKFNDFKLDYARHKSFLNETIIKLEKLRKKDLEEEVSIDMTESISNSIIIEDDDEVLQFDLVNESGKKKKKKSQFPEHQWKDSAIRFKNENGKWGKWVDLKGNSGRDGASGGGIGKNKVLQLITQSLLNFTGSGVSFGVGPIAAVDQSSYSLGTSSFVAKQDHTHFHGYLTGVLHSDATLTQSGFFNANEKIQLTLTPLTSTQTVVGLNTYVEYINYI